jgi:hypothetical protein
MPLFYVTGLSGTGKSAVMNELQARGFEARGVDEHDYADWVNRKTGTIDIFPHDDASLDIHKWYQDHDWVLSSARVSQLSNRAKRLDKAIFLCGVASGDDKVWHYFDKVISLVISEPTLKERISKRQDQFGKSPEELAQILIWHTDYEKNYRRLGATIVDAGQPLQKVVKDVLDATNLA